MFKKVLIANRGEIACRIIRTCRKLGIATVAVYSDADAGALHTHLADEAVPIGRARASESYLVIDRLVDACRASGADAVHPGYGFLSENAEFAEALGAAGVAFIGPNAEAIRSMGDKIRSKLLAVKACVNVLPGSEGAVADIGEALRRAHDIGYPVMLKASAGGGGRGIRIAHSDAELKERFQQATTGAESAFKDGRVFIERYVEDARHIEMQVFGDRHGNVVYLGERECSIQRRHQKIIEEAPSPLLDEMTRAEMGRQAVALAKAVNYDSAGTVEFVVDQKQNFYFLEMNTRLQVEHPVTELTTGLDLVEMMIRSALGERLAIRQSDVACKGWAFEARLYAEDPSRGFAPSPGRALRFHPPAQSRHIRVDTGIVEGAEVTHFYDPLIAKLCTYGETRDDAAKLMWTALQATKIEGLSTNLAFLSELFAHPRFLAGRLSTGLIADEWPGGYKPKSTP